MIINLPMKNGEPVNIDGKNSIVLIGANGSGKTRMGVWIDQNNSDLSIHRISAQKSLTMPVKISPSDFDSANELFLYGTSNENKEWLKNTGKNNSRWGRNPSIHLLNDYDALMQLLATDHFQKSLEYRSKHKSGMVEYTNESNLEKIQRIWAAIITHRSLIIEAGKISVKIDSEVENNYNGAEMSDGERAIFYFIGEVISAPQDSLIIIDEPENHLHNAILVNLWNAIEYERPDCMFLYITHNFQFASSRVNSELIWVQNMSDTNTWIYEIIAEDTDIDELKLQLLGTRQKIILVEGSYDKSTDRKVYSALFKEYAIFPVDNCQRVIQYTRAYKEIPSVHHGDVIGIIDRDRLSQESVDRYKREGIYTLGVAEIENLFLLDDVIRFVGEQLNKDSDEITSILDLVHFKTFEFLEHELDAQALLFTKQSMTNGINQVISRQSADLTEYQGQLQAVGQLNVIEVYEQERSKLQQIIDASDYTAALRAINNKGLLPYTTLTTKFGWKKDYYIDYVIGLLRSTREEHQPLKEVFAQFIKID